MSSGTIHSRVVIYGIDFLRDGPRSRSNMSWQTGRGSSPTVDASGASSVSRRKQVARLGSMTASILASYCRFAMALTSVCRGPMSCANDLGVFSAPLTQTLTDWARRRGSVAEQPYKPCVWLLSHCVTSTSHLLWNETADNGDLECNTI